MTWQTEQEYLRAMLDAVPLETWQAVVARAVTDALNGEDKARAWLSKYLVGEPQTKAATPTQVVIQQMVGGDPALTEAARQLARPILDREYPDKLAAMLGDPARETRAAELQEQIEAEILDAENVRLSEQEGTDPKAKRKATEVAG